MQIWVGLTLKKEHLKSLYSFKLAFLKLKSVYKERGIWYVSRTQTLIFFFYKNLFFSYQLYLFIKIVNFIIFIYL